MRLATIAVALAGAAATQLSLLPHSTECFYETVQSGNKLTGSFEVISGGLLDVDAAVYGPQGEAHYSVHRQRQGVFTVMAHVSGVYRLCFSNRMSTLSEKVVAFSMHAGDALYQEISSRENMSPLENEVTQLVDAVAAMEDEQKYMWARERAAREMNDATNARVLYWSIAEAVILIVMAAWQIWSLRTFFEKKRSY